MQEEPCNADEDANVREDAGRPAYEDTNVRKDVGRTAHEDANVHEDVGRTPHEDSRVGARLLLEKTEGRNSVSAFLILRVAPSSSVSAPAAAASALRAPPSVRNSTRQSLRFEHSTKRNWNSSNRRNTKYTACCALYIYAFCCNTLYLFQNYPD